MFPCFCASIRALSMSSDAGLQKCTFFAFNELSPHHLLQAVESKRWVLPPDSLPDSTQWPTWGALRERILTSCTGKLSCPAPRYSRDELHSSTTNPYRILQRGGQPHGLRNMSVYRPADIVVNKFEVPDEVPRDQHDAWPGRMGEFLLVCRAVRSLQRRLTVNLCFWRYRHAPFVCIYQLSLSRRSVLRSCVQTR